MLSCASIWTSSTSIAFAVAKFRTIHSTWKRNGFFVHLRFKTFETPKCEQSQCMTICLQMALMEYRFLSAVWRHLLWLCLVISFRDSQISQGKKGNKHLAGFSAQILWYCPCKMRCQTSPFVHSCVHSSHAVLGFCVSESQRIFSLIKYIALTPFVLLQGSVISISMVRMSSIFSVCFNLLACYAELLNGQQIHAKCCDTIDEALTIMICNKNQGNIFSPWQ